MDNSKLSQKLADFAGRLPIGKKLNELNFSQPGILIGETACGKSLVTPVLAYLTGGFRRIIVRQPTRLASYLLMKSMQDIYGDSISVGCINRDQKINPDASILEVTDGILIEWLRDKQIWYDELIILDEIHATTEQLEISMGLIKRQGHYPWCLSATIAPEDIMKYFDARVYYVTGINYPINKNQVYAEPKDFLMGRGKIKGYIEDKMIKGGNSCLVFLPTRYDTEWWASEIEQFYGDKVICKYIHGGVDVKEMSPFSHKENLDKPFILFSTPVSEQSITLDLDDVIIVNQKIIVNEYMGVKVQQRTYLPPNSLIQMMGRCGRYREGNVYVICDNYSPKIDFDSLYPTSVTYSLASNTPYELAIILAGSQIKLQDVELITEVDKEEYQFAVRILRKRKILDSSGRLTKEGYAVMNIPLDYNLAQFVATAPDDILDMVIFTAGFGSHSIYHIEKFFPEGVPRGVIRKREKLAVFESDLLTKYNIARNFYGLSEEEMQIRAEELGLNLHVITNALNAAKAVYDHLNISPPDTLPELTGKYIKKFQEHVFNIMLFPPVQVKSNYYNNGYSCYIDDMKAFTDSSATIRGGEREIIFSSKTQVQNRYGEWFIRLSDNTICPTKLRAWCWPEETVKEFLGKYIFLSPSGEIFCKIPEKKYYFTAKFLQKILTLIPELEYLYNRSPGHFKNDRIGFEEIIEDTLIEICVDERIKSLKELERYMAEGNVSELTLEDFISSDDIEYIRNNYPDKIEIKGNKYSLIYVRGEVWVEIPWEVLLELEEGETGISNFIILIKDEKGILNRLRSRGLKEARKEIEYFVTKKAWKKAKKSCRKKIRIRSIKDILHKILEKKYITDFLGEPVYGWTGFRYNGRKSDLLLFKSYNEAEKETKKALKEYFRDFLKAEVNRIRIELPEKNRKKLKLQLKYKGYDIEDWCNNRIDEIDMTGDFRKSINNLFEELKIKHSELKEALN